MVYWTSTSVAGDIVGRWLQSLRNSDAFVKYEAFPVKRRLHIPILTSICANLAFICANLLSSTYNITIASFSISFICLAMAGSIPPYF